MAGVGVVVGLPGVSGDGVGTGVVGLVGAVEAVGDPTATLPAATDLAGGTTNLTVYFNTNGNFTLTASDLDDGTRTPTTSPAITTVTMPLTGTSSSTSISSSDPGRHLWRQGSQR